MLNNSTKLNTNRKFGLLIFVFFAAYYLLLLYNRVGTDIQAHLMVSYKFINEHGPLTPNFLYFILVALLAGCSKYKMLYYASSILLIAAALAAKFLFNNKYVQKITENSLSNSKALLFAVSMLFVFCLPGVDFFGKHTFFLGLLAPNVWHNSTVIFLFPFAVALFFESYYFLTGNEQAGKKQLIRISALIIINLLIKPSFLFTVIPSVFLMALFCKTSVSKLTTVLLYGGGLLLILLQYIIIYKTNSTSNCQNCSESVIIEPFAVWKYYTSNILISFVASFLFPVCFFVLSNHRIWKDKLVLFAVINWIIGMVIYILFTESGERKYHGNFSWQMVTGNYLLFFVLATRLWQQDIVTGTGMAKITFLRCLFYAHVVWGMAYFFSILVLKSYD